MKSSEFKDLVEHLDLLEKQVDLATDHIRILRRHLEVVAENDAALPQLQFPKLEDKGKTNVA